MKIYTKTGDKGETGLADGKRLLKSEEIFWLMGEVDELSAQIGFSISVNQYIGKSVRQYDSKTVDSGKQQKSRSPACIALPAGHASQGDAGRQSMAGRQDSKKDPSAFGRLPKDDVSVNLKRIQGNLFTVNAMLAGARNVKFNSEKEVEWLEKEIDEMTTELPELKNFILPGGSEISATLHVARTVCRRVERRFVMCQHGTMMAQKGAREILQYFNRLSDYLFTLARFVNFKMGEREEKWRG